MKTVIIILLLAILVILGLLAFVITRLGRRTYQRYSGLERQRASARQARDAGADRLKDAERLLIDAQRGLAERGQYSQAQQIERLRTRLSTMTDQLRHAAYGYAPIGSPDPIQEEELAGLQRHDADTISDAAAIASLAQALRDTARAAEAALDLRALESALDQLRASLQRRRPVN